VSSTRATLVVGVVPLLEIGLGVERLVDRDLELFGDELGELVRLGERDLVHAADIADRGPGLERPERDDLRDVPVLLADVVDDLAPPVLAEVDIDIGVLGPVGVGEALEEQAVVDGAGVGEAEHEPDHRAHARATGERGDAALAPPVHEVPDDQEVRADQLVGEDLELAVELTYRSRE
jgi:hypothetical protein